MPDSSLNDFSLADEPLYERTEIDGIEFVRDADGAWRYADNWILVPGARDVTLTERFRPKLIIDAEEEVERVVVSGNDIAAAPELLNWCIAEGRLITDGDELVEVLVPYEQWRARDRVPGALISPEHHGSEAEQQVAAAERQFREAEQQLDKAASYRAEVLRQHADEMTRQEARAITGLSVGRVQQLIREEMDSPDPEAMSEAQVEQLDLSLMWLATRGPRNMDALHRLLTEETRTVYPTNLIRRRITTLAERGLLSASGKGVVLRPKGVDALSNARHSGKLNLLDGIG